MKWKLTFAVVLSSLWIAAAHAHEVLPTIADISSDGQVLRLVMEVNVEAQLSGIDLDSVADTNDSENAASYDALRAESGETIAVRAADLVARWNSLSLVRIDERALALDLAAVAVADVPNAELPRTSRLELEAVLPSGATEVTVSWPAGAGALVLRQQGVEDAYTGYLEGGATSPEIALGGGGAVGGWQTFVDYIPVGFDHILPKGLDHILFVLGLFFLSTSLGPLLWQVSAFTLAHTVTLALGALGLVNVPGSIVEPLIAASIVYVAVENIFAHKLQPWRPLVVFGFGLLHGLGFASVLGEFGLPEGAFVPALIGFNIGVELGQLTVIAMAVAVVWMAVQAARAADFDGEDAVIEGYGVMFRAVSVTGSLMIAFIGAWWVVERTLL